MVALVAVAGALASGPVDFAVDVVTFDSADFLAIAGAATIRDAAVLADKARSAFTLAAARVSTHVASRHIARDFARDRNDGSIESNARA